MAHPLDVSLRPGLAKARTPEADDDRTRQGPSSPTTPLSRVPDAWLRLADNAWVLLAAYGLLLGLVSLLWLVRGQLFDREIYEAVGGVSWSLARGLDAGVVDLVAALVRLAGVLGAAFAAFVVAVSATAYRRRERWAWYVMWTLPIASTADVAVLAAYGGLSLRSLLWDLYLLALSVTGLALPLLTRRDRGRTTEETWPPRP